MIRMEIIRAKKEMTENRLEKYQQNVKEMEVSQNDSSKDVRRGCDTAD